MKRAKTNPNNLKLQNDPTENFKIGKIWNFFQTFVFQM